MGRLATYVLVAVMVVVSGCAHNEPGPLPDGEHFGFVSGYADSQITFDPAELFLGDEAWDALKEDEGEDAPEPPNGFHVRYADQAAVLVAVDEEVTAEVIDATDMSNRTLSAAELADLYEGGDAHWWYDGPDRWPAWIVVTDGAVIELRQQYLP